jgi:hypothetical protein
MNRIIVTPAGRRRYLEILHKNLEKCRDEFDKWIIWVNTTDLEDITFIENLHKNYSYIELSFSEIPVDPNGSHTATICHFFKKCTDKNSVYLRLDDDIVYIHKNSIKDLFDYRINNKEPFLVFGNILNNAIITNLYQRFNVLNHLPQVSYNCEDELGWRSASFSYSLHNYFFDKKIKNQLTDFFIQNWELKNFERCSINSISWLGETFSLFNGIVGLHEEIWLSTDKPKELSAPNIIFGNSLFVHYAFAPQRQFLESTDILEKYKNITL